MTGRAAALRLAATLFAGLALGCEAEAEAAEPTPTGPPEGWDVPCELEREGDFCTCAGFHDERCDALPDAACLQPLSICIPLPVGAEDVFIDDYGSLPPGTQRHCSTGHFGLSDEVVYEALTTISGPCVPDWVCASILETDIEGRCRYSDATVYERGPPSMDTCPRPPDALTPFCGGVCGACPHHEPPDFAAEWSTWRVQCLGRSETRALGICTFGTLTCSERQTLGEPGDCEGVYGQPCACLRERNAEGELRSWGQLTLRDACVAYRERYPGAVECMDRHAWEALP